MCNCGGFTVPRTYFSMSRAKTQRAALRTRPTVVKTPPAPPEPVDEEVPADG